MKRQVEHVLGLIDRANEQGYPALAYMHVQDYHLQTVIYSVDYDDREYINAEIRNAVELFNMIDDSYTRRKSSAFGHQTLLISYHRIDLYCYVSIDRIDRKQDEGSSS